MHFPAFLNEDQIKTLQQEELASEKVQKRTAEQIEAIYLSGHNILVSASAGSGKTFVMVERIMDKIMRGIPIDRMFISTFTVKAATELKERLEKKLLLAIKENQSPQWKVYLNQQLQLIHQADIGTMDSFTQKLVTEYSYHLGISPKFRIMQENSEQDMLKKTVYENLFSTYLKGNRSQTFLKLVKNFSGKRKDSLGFRKLVYQVYEFSQSTQDPLFWLENILLKASDKYASFDSIADSEVEALLQTMQQTAQDLRDLTELEDYDQMTKAGKPSAKYRKHLAIIQALEENSLHFETYYGKEKLSLLAKEMLAFLPSGDSVTVNKRPYVIFRDLQRRLREWQHLDTILLFQAETKPLLELLKTFVIDFSQAYLVAKRKENAFEFSDIAHFAIQLLEDYPEIQKAYQDKYHEVMVDEYQDNNHMQERLLELLSTGHNRFMVGDIKQSIYRFRQADPLIFNQKFKAYQENPALGRLILLKENFRSQSEVLEVTNSIFSHLMDEEIGDILYDDSHRLLAGSDRQREKHPENRAKFILYDDKVKSELEDDTEQQMTSSSHPQISPGQVRIVAKEMLRLHQVENVPFSDMTLLVSSRTRNENIFKTFDQFGIPLVSDGGNENYLQSVEMMVMLDTLRTINNPLNDYALVALLKSPMFAFDEDQLARIALQESSEELIESFYEKMLNGLAKNGRHSHLITNDLLNKIDFFINQLNSWRQFAQKNSLYDLIWQIYNQRFYYDYVANGPKGEQAQANLYALAIRASQFEKAGYKGLSRFINMIDRILETENDLAGVDVPKPKDAVNLMTIHKSKGLEFKYVFILNSDQKFGFQDLKAPAIMDRCEGIGIKYLADLKSYLDAQQFSSLKVILETLPYQVLRKAIKRATLSEQMRLLYVAMTRAEKKLYIIGKGQEEKLADKFDGQRQGNRLAKNLRENLQSFQDWILALAANFEKEDLHLDISYVSDAELTDDQIGKIEQGARLQPDQLIHNRQTEQIARALDMLEKVNLLNQAYQAAIHLPTVQTPSQIKSFYHPIMDSEGVAVIEKAQIQQKPSFKLPDFGDKSKVEASQIGSALHETMQKISLHQTPDLPVIEKAIQLVDASDLVKAHLDKAKILAFFTETELGRLLIQKVAHLHREAPFAMLKKDSLSQENFVVRGIIDGYLLFEDKIILFDYKTDKYQDAQEMKTRYQDQLSLYAEALTKAYGISLVEKYLVLLGGEKLEVIAV